MSVGNLKYEMVAPSNDNILINTSINKESLDVVVEEEEEFANEELGGFHQLSRMDTLPMGRSTANTVYTNSKSVMSSHDTAAFLDKKTQHLLDMSLIKSRNIQGIKLGSKILSTDGRYIYHISIIDYLQKYTCQKKMEHCYKRTFLNTVGDEISSINVRRYQSRFMEFMRNKVFNYDFNNRIDVCQFNEALEGLDES